MAKRVYFAFHYEDVIDLRANVVRNHNALTDAQRAGYFDASIWETAKKHSNLALKRMINSEMKNTSVTAVLIGSETYARTWVRYEIFRSIEIGNNLIGIHINSIKGKNGKIKTRGSNPFDHLGLEISNDGKKGSPIVWNGSKWIYFSKYNPFAIERTPVSMRGKSFRLSGGYNTKDWIADNGYQNFSDWI